MIPAARHRLFNINGWMHSRNSRRSEVQGTDRSSSIDSGESGRPVKPVSIILNEYSFSQTGPLSQLLLSHSIRLLLPCSQHPTGVGNHTLLHGPCFTTSTQH